MMMMMHLFVSENLKTNQNDGDVIKVQNETILVMRSKLIT